MTTDTDRLITSMEIATQLIDLVRAGVNLRKMRHPRNAFNCVVEQVKAALLKILGPDYVLELRTHREDAIVGNRVIYNIRKISSDKVYTFLYVKTVKHLAAVWTWWDKLMLRLSKKPRRPSYIVHTDIYVELKADNAESQFIIPVRSADKVISSTSNSYMDVLRRKQKVYNEVDDGQFKRIFSSGADADSPSALSHQGHRAIGRNSNNGR